MPNGRLFELAETRALRWRLPIVQRRGRARDRHGRTAFEGTVHSPAFPPASIPSTGKMADCSFGPDHPRRAVRAWARPPSRRTSHTTSPPPTNRRYSRRLLQGQERRRGRLLFARNVVRNSLATRIISGRPKSPPRRSAAVTFRKRISRSSSPCSQMMQKVPLYIDQTGGISIAQLAARAPVEAAARPGRTGSTTSSS